MIEIGDKIVSADLLTSRFLCDLSICKGICCVEGNAGAPLDVEEIDILENEYDAYRKYMKPEGIKSIERYGFTVLDEDGDYTTPLIGDAECAYSFDKEGVTMCAIEQAYNNGETSFRKPISCHLYPIRLVNFTNGGIGLNYHRWSVCSAAECNGERLGIPVYRSLKEAIVRRFGEEFFVALEQAEEYLCSEIK